MRKKKKREREINRKQFKRHQTQQGRFGRRGGSQQCPCSDLPGFSAGGAAPKARLHWNQHRGQRQLALPFEGPSLPGDSGLKPPPAIWETWVWSLGREDTLEKGMATHACILAGELDGQRSLVGYSPWGGRESTRPNDDHFTFTCPLETGLLLVPERTNYPRAHTRYELRWSTFHYVPCQ